MYPISSIKRLVSWVGQLFPPLRRYTEGPKHISIGWANYMSVIHNDYRELVTWYVVQCAQCAIRTYVIAVTKYAPWNHLDRKRLWLNELFCHPYKHLAVSIGNHTWQYHLCKCTPLHKKNYLLSHFQSQLHEGSKRLYRTSIHWCM